MSMTDPTVSTHETLLEVRDHLDQWETGVDKLEEAIHHIKKESQRAYLDQIAVLRQHLKEIRLRLRAIEAGEPKEWRESRVAFYQRLTRFRQAFLQTANSLVQEDSVTLGWLQGFTEERTHDSAGWAEGMGEMPGHSAGWAEGMGHRPEGSKGWAEGYDKANKK